MPEIAIPNSYLINNATGGEFKVPKKISIVLDAETVSSSSAPDSLIPLTLKLHK